MVFEYERNTLEATPPGFLRIAEVFAGGGRAERGHAALQRVVVRMLFDQAFADRVCADAAAAVAGLDEGERGSLVKLDRLGDDADRAGLLARPRRARCGQGERAP